jgi:2-polyprenyl-3-methyl-5-hydroxy-6-metoxy-1,4-benzoquinol methylase
MSQKTIERIYTESWAKFLGKGKKGYPAATNPFGLAIADLVGSQQKVLDIGCGTGKCVLPVAARGNDVIGVDVSPDALNVLQELGFTGIKLDIEQDSV